MVSIIAIDHHDSSKSLCCSGEALNLLSLVCWAFTCIYDQYVKTNENCHTLVLTYLVERQGTENFYAPEYVTVDWKYTKDTIDQVVSNEIKET